MITHLNIQNFAIIDEIDLDFYGGLHIFTGETGTGKSILIQGINLALGGRGSTTYIRKGKDKATIQLIIQDDSPQLLELSAKHNIDMSGKNELIITRELHSSGKSICRVNGNIVTLTELSQLCKRLVDVHGQYDHQSLLNPGNNLSLLDSYHEDNILPVKSALSTAYLEYESALRQLSKIRKNSRDNLRKQDFMKYEFNEIEAANIYPGEDDELSQRLKILQNSEKIYENLNISYSLLYENPLGKVLQHLSTITEYDPVYASWEEALSENLYVLEDICNEMRRAKEELTFSSEEIDDIIIRLNLLDNLKRKYGGSLEKILEYKNELSAQIEEFENFDEIEKELEEKIVSLEEKVKTESLKLRELRKNSAAELQEKIQEELKDLNFQNALFQISFNDKITADGKIAYAEDGIDVVAFLFSANRGEDLLPLSEAASGGEISRIMLAFKRIIGQFDQIPSMIFDEIDTGISGITASIVGKKLYQISKSHQIFCVTHLPQIASVGDHHYCIEKNDNLGKISTAVRELTEDERVLEISRLLGGMDVTENTVRSAKEMLAASGNRSQ